MPMNKAELAERRQQLQYRSAQQRLVIASGIKPLLPLFSTLDTTGNALRWIRRNAALSAGALLLLGVMRPRFMFRWAKRGLFAWQSWRRVSRLLRK